MEELRKIMVNSFKMSSARTSAFSGPPHTHTAAGQYQLTPPPETPRHSQASMGQSFVGPLLLSPGSWCAQVSVCALQDSISPALCKFWQLSGGVNGDLLQEGLCHTQMCCIQSPCPCSRPLLTLPPQGTFKHSSDSETQFLPLTAFNAQTLV